MVSPYLFNYFSTHSHPLGALPFFLSYGCYTPDALACLGQVIELWFFTACKRVPCEACYCSVRTSHSLPAATQGLLECYLVKTSGKWVHLLKIALYQVLMTLWLKYLLHNTEIESEFSDFQFPDTGSFLEDYYLRSQLDRNTSTGFS